MILSAKETDFHGKVSFAMNEYNAEVAAEEYWISMYEKHGDPWILDRIADVQRLRMRGDPDLGGEAGGS